MSPYDGRDLAGCQATETVLKEGQSPMESRNPILNNSETFNGQAARTYGHPTTPPAARATRDTGRPRAPAGTDPTTWQLPDRQATSRSR